MLKETMTALITGATNGTGRALAERLDQEGYQVVVHGRDPEKIAAVASSLRNNPETLEANFNDPDQVKNRFNGLLDKGVVPEVIFHLAADGMSSYKTGMGLGLKRLLLAQRKGPERFASQIAEFEASCINWITSNREYTYNVNVHSPLAILDAIDQKGLNIQNIDLSSLWSSFGRMVPLFYVGIAESKGEAEKGFQPGRDYILSAGVVDGTGVGGSYRELVIPLGAKEVQQASLNKFVRLGQVINSLVVVAEMPLDIRGPRGYLYGPDGNKIRKSLTREEQDEALDLGLDPRLLTDLPAFV